MNKKLSTFVFLIIISIGCHAQNLVKQFPVFQSGERISYSAVYNWGFIWLNAGYVEFKVNKLKYNRQDVYHFSSYGTSIPSYDWLFKVRDYFQSYAKMDNLAPLFFERNNFEGGYCVHNRFTFNYTDSLIYTQIENSDKPYSEDTLIMLQNVYDVISGVYHIRNIDFDQYQINDTIPVRMIIDNEIFDLYVRFLGREVIKLHNKQKFKTIKFSALLVEGTIFKGGEDLLIWVTDDLNRIPVLIEAKILIGSVKATLLSTENLKFPLDSEITEQ